MNILYSKYTDYRSKQFQIYTSIIENEERKQVVKEAVYEEGKKHIRHIADMYNRLKEQNTDDRISYCPCVYKEEKVFFDFVEGKTLKSRIENAVREYQKEEVLYLLNYYCSLLSGGGKTLLPFRKTEDFEEWFGVVDGLKDEYALPISNLDCNVGNMIFSEGKEIIIDYEWVMEFPVPINFIVYINLSWLYHFDVPSLQEVMTFSELLNIAGLDEKKISIYALMEQRHGKKIDIEPETGVNMFSLKDANLKQPFIDLNRLEMTIINQTDEKETAYNIVKRLDAVSKHVKFNVNVPKGTKKLQMMITGERACFIKWFYIYDSGKEVSYQVKNGYRDGVYLFFDAKVPVIEIELLEPIETIEISGHYYFTEDKDLIDVFHRNALRNIEGNQLLAEKNRIELELQQSKEEAQLAIQQINGELESQQMKAEQIYNELQQIKESKSWKMINKVNRLIDKIKGE